MPNVKDPLLKSRLTDRDIMASMFVTIEELLHEYRNVYATNRVYELLKIWKDLKIELRKRKVIG